MKRSVRIALWAAVAVVVLVGVFVGAARATDASAFCETCHEMRPYYDAWSAGTHGHENVPCVDCHVGRGFVPRLAHKFVALGEVWNHFFGNRSFPLATAPGVPNVRCTPCHANVAVNLKNFSHTLHASKASCRNCHPDTGHNVSTQALKDAGVYNSSVVATPFAGAVAVVNGGAADLPGHVKVTCTRCHDMKVSGCRACHAPPKNARHKGQSDCSLCHKPGRQFVFTHPGPRVHCANCHKPPERGHPDPNATRACTDCHKSVASWAFAHPSSASKCVACHAPPKNHFGTRCASCHHRPGVSWAFAHPSAGEHSWQSMPCAKCHPNGYSNAYCTCHGGNAPRD